jgi:hypothetical protein
MKNTREVATGYRLERWAGIVRERAESGLTVKAFCESAGIHQNSYYYWQRKLREVVCESMSSGALPTPGGWAAVVSEGSGTAEVTGALSIEIGKCRVHADGDTDERLLAKVCRVLASL